MIYNKPIFFLVKIGVNSFGCLSKFDASLTPFSYLYFAGKELPNENTWNGVTIHEPKCQPLAAPSLQKSSATQSITKFVNPSEA